MDDSAQQVHLPGDVDWQMLDKSKFFFLGATLFSSVSAALYPIVVLKTRQQILPSHVPCHKICMSLVKREGFPGLYRGFSTSLMGTIPARALYMTTLEVTRSNVGTTFAKLGCPESTASAIANASAGLSAAIAAQLVWTPVDVVSQRLMVQSVEKARNVCGFFGYSGGIDAFRKILTDDGPRGLYRGFGISILTYAPSNAVWWASYSVAQRGVWGVLGGYGRKSEATGVPDWKTVMLLQGVSAGFAGGVSAVMSMPLDTVKTRLQVLEGNKCGSLGETVRNLVREGGWMACYRGLGLRWASMSMSSTVMITTYEFLKRLSAKPPDTS